MTDRFRWFLYSEFIQCKKNQLMPCFKSLFCNETLKKRLTGFAHYEAPFLKSLKHLHERTCVCMCMCPKSHDQAATMQSQPSPSFGGVTENFAAYRLRTYESLSGRITGIFYEMKLSIALQNMKRIWLQVVCFWQVNQELLFVNKSPLPVLMLTYPCSVVGWQTYLECCVYTVPRAYTYF